VSIALHPELSVIIVNWNTRQLLDRCLETIYNTIGDLTFEVFVVDNASQDGSVEMVKAKYPEVHLLLNEVNLGFGKANNQAIRCAQGNYCLLVNTDAFIQPDCAQVLVSTLAQHSKIGIAGTNLTYPNGRPQICKGRLPTLGIEIARLFGLDRIFPIDATYSPLKNGYQDTGYVMGACMIARLDCLQQIGLFDEEYVFFSEEIDLCCRAAKNNWKVVHVPAAKAVHIGGGSTRSNTDRILSLYKGKLMYFDKHHGPRTKQVFWRMIWLTLILKIPFYFVLRILSFGQIDKANLWLDVARKFSQINPA
jgi:GT2 family glycosyltransferase